MPIQLYDWLVCVTRLEFSSTIGWFVSHDYNMRMKKVKNTFGYNSFLGPTQTLVVSLNTTWQLLMCSPEYRVQCVPSALYITHVIHDNQYDV